jgi:hypothetical protein
MTFVMQVDSPCDERVMIRRCPCIRREVDVANMVLEDVVDTFTTALEGRLDVAPDGGGRWNDGGGATSFHQSYELSIGNDLRRAGTFHTPTDKVGPCFVRCVRTMCDFDRGLALTRKGSKDRAIALFGCRFGTKGCFDDVIAEAAEGVGLEVGGCTSIFGILVTTHAVKAFVAAVLSCALEEVIFATVVVADGDVAGEKLVDSRTPAILETS